MIIILFATEYFSANNVKSYKQDTCLEIFVQLSQKQTIHSWGDNIRMDVKVQGC